MNLVVVTNILTPYRIPLFEALAHRVEDFTVLLMAEREENRQWRLDQPRFRVVLLPGIHYRPQGRAVSLHLNYGTMSCLRQLRPDVVLSGGFTSANVAAFVYCKVFRKRFVGWGELSRRDCEPTGMVRGLLRRWMITGSDGSIASSSDATDAFVHYGAPRDRVLLSLMAVEVDKLRQRTRAYRETEACRTARRKFKGPVLLSIGRLTRSKGYPELFDIYRRLRAWRPDLSLVIVGDGPDRERYARYVMQQGWRHVHFSGFVQTDELPKYLAVADLFVFHTLTDPFGAVLSEAMAAELPVVASVYAGATRDLVEEGVTGFRIDPKEPDSSAVAIVRALDLPPGRLASFREAAYDRVKAFDIEPSAERMVGFLRWLVDTGTPRAVDAGRPLPSRHG